MNMFYAILHQLRLILLLGGLTMLSIPLQAQVYTGDLTLSTQAEVNAFAYTEVTGTLTISGNSINSLSALSTLTSVGGHLRISGNAALTSLNGLSALTSVGGSLGISGNDALTSLDGLSALTSVVGSLGISGNDALTSLDGLSAITSVERLIIANNDALTNLDGLSTITSIGGNLMIKYNPALTNLDGLSSITSVELLIIANNDALTSLDGLSAITSIRSLAIRDNNALTNLDGLSAITSIGGSLDIRNNDALTNLDGLSAITSVGGNLNIVDNDALTNLDGLSAITSVVRLIIANNDALTNLDGLSTITSIIGLDIRNNDALTNLDGLSTITSIGGSLSIRRNDALTNLDGLSTITSIIGLEISNNDALTSLDGLSAITSIRSLAIRDNNALTNLDGLSAITSIRSLDIRNNDALTNLDGLSAITSIGYLTISGNDALTSLAGLSALTSVGGWIEISNNDALTSLNGLSALKSVGGLIIRNNSVLDQFCGLYPLLSGGTVGGFSCIGNKENPTVAAIVAAGACVPTGCTGTPPTISSVAPTDETCDGQHNGRLEVTATGSGPFDYSKDGGLTWQSNRRFRKLSDGDYPIMVRLRSDPTCKTNVQTATVSAGPARTTATATATAEGCPGDTDGTITLSATGTTGILSYVLGNDAPVNFTAGTSHTLSSLPAGRYRFRVYDAANAACPSKPVRVRVEASKQQPTFDLAVIQPPIRPGSGPEQYLGEDKLFLTFKGVTVTGAPTGTIPAHQYAMTPPGSTTPNAYLSVAAATKTEGQNAFFEVPGASTPGTYTFTIIDPNGCESEPQSITLNDPAVCNATANTSREDVNTKFRASHGSDNRLWQHVYQPGTYQQRYRVRNLVGAQQLKLEWALVSLTEAGENEGVTYTIGGVPGSGTLAGTEGPFASGVQTFNAGGAIWGREEEAEKKANATFKLIPILVLPTGQQCYGEPVEKKMIIRPVPQLSLANTTQPGQTISIPSGGDPNGKISLELVNPIQENTEVQLLYAVEIAQNPSIVELSAGGVSIPHYKQNVGPTPPKYPANTSSDLTQPFDPFQALAEERSISTFTLAAGVTDPVRVTVTITPISFPIPAVTEEGRPSVDPAAKAAAEAARRGTPQSIDIWVMP